MTYSEIESALPNGFHDALLEAIGLNFPAKSATMDIWVSIGNPESKTREDKEGYKKARLHLTGLIYIQIDLGFSELTNDKPLRIDAGDADSNNQSQGPKPIKPLPRDAFAFWLFVETFEFIHPRCSFRRDPRIGYH